MGLISWFEQSMTKFKWYDITLIKWSALFGTLFLLTVWPALRDLLLGVSWYWYFLLMIIVVIRPMKVMFSK